LGVWPTGKMTTSTSVTKQKLSGRETA
jgi:hypothetical protein